MDHQQIKPDLGSDPKKPSFSWERLRRSYRILSYIRPYRGYFLAAMVMLAGGSLVFMALLGLPGEMANTAVGKPKFELGLKVRDYGIVFLIILVFQGILSFLRTYFFAIVSEKGMADLRKDLYRKIITQPVYFFEERRVGELSSRITADIEKLQSVFSITLAEFFRQLIILIAGIIVIIIWTPQLSMIMLLTFPAIVIIAMVFGRYIRRLSKERQDQLAETNTIVEETFQSFAIVKSFANEWLESRRYAGSIERVVGTSLQFARIRGVFFAFIISVLFGGIFFILWQGALMVEDGTMESGDLFSFIIYTGVLGGAIASFGALYTELLSAMGATERILEILDADTELAIDEDGPHEPLLIDGHITYDNVCFSYPSRPDVQVLKGINLEARPGQKIALVGQSGSGKSTLAQLLMQFYHPKSGRILVDGKEISTFNLTSYRRTVGIVPQEVMLFGGTIRENIAYGKPGATEEEILAAAESSNCTEFIGSFPQGMDTIVGERGIKLSGGQRQRIAIARAILKDPKILILDEATSSLDAESEKLVQEALDVLMQNRTSVIIAHRLATIREVDCIYVLDKGKIVEKGSHQELTQMNDGIYQNLAKLQFETSAQEEA
ncbi:MAG: ATP-binding cassette domain-containing protein [Saprospiraceae bacterium]|nr:ATP-binding cassette domain-containing protein [Saprospiraceae bacterium]